MFYIKVINVLYLIIFCFPRVSNSNVFSFPCYFVVAFCILLFHSILCVCVCVCVCLVLVGLFVCCCLCLLLFVCVCFFCVFFMCLFVSCFYYVWFFFLGVCGCGWLGAVFLSLHPCNLF